MSQSSLGANERKLLIFALITGFIWGFAEGTLLFVVPDALLCYWALNSWRAALYSTVSVVIGAMAAAIILYIMLNYNSGFYFRLHSLWEYFPGFYPKMVETAANHIQDGGAKGLI